MTRPLHIGIVSVLFDRKPEGICTGRLVRALLEAGHHVTLWTSSKADLTFRHERLQVLVAPSGIRSPRWLFRLAARCTATIPSNFYLWTRRIATRLPGGGVPDVVYGRAWPHASLVAAEMLARRLNRPLILHLSDPFPQPPDTRIDSAFMTDLQILIERSAAVTFTNRASIDYQRRFVNLPQGKAAVLNHVAPPVCSFGPATDHLTFYHIGMVRPDRPAEPLLDGFALYQQRQPDARLYFVGDVAGYLKPLIAERQLGDVVKVLPFTRDVQGVMARASVLVTLDANVAAPVFTPTKVVEYLCCDRPVLAITPPGSPVEELMRRCPESAVAVTDYGPEAIAAGLDAAAGINCSPQGFARRFAVMAEYSPAIVAAAFSQLAASVLAAPQQGLDT